MNSGKLLPKALFYPEPVREKHFILPVFIPFAGCTTRCIYCEQGAQTGVKTFSVDAVLQGLEQNLAAREKKQMPPCEVAFYGGSFTALPEETQEAFLTQVQPWQDRGVVNACRCSTRPDFIVPEHLSRLRSLGLTMIELGVQSFTTKALTAARRSYDALVAHAACQKVLDSGLQLGIQLMPGMPGVSSSVFREDIAVTCSFQPHGVRLYPCLVLRGTPLAELWEQGAYSPWELDATVEHLAEACLSLWEHSIPIFRMGVAMVPSLEGAVLAGPQHPALGSMVRGRALFSYLSAHLAVYKEAASGSEISGPRMITLHIPRRYQGEFWGYQGSLHSAYAALGITKQSVVWHDGEAFIIQPE